MKTFLLVSSLSIFFWLGWCAHLCWWLNGRWLRHDKHRRLDARLWLERLSGPMLAMLLWSLLAFAAAAWGWL